METNIVDRIKRHTSGLIKNLILNTLPVSDMILMPLVYPAAWLLKNIRRFGVHKLPLCKSALMKIEVFPIINYYYEPKFDNSNPRLDFSEDRNLQGIDWNISEQLKLLGSLTFSQELLGLPEKPEETQSSLEFCLNNGVFESGDAEYWYQIIRAIKPKKILEIGSGCSTLMAIKAINMNHKEDPSYTCEHICIEPYEVPWLEKTGASIIRKGVEEIELSFFYQLQENDILFIDSSHIIRPQGDVLFEYLELLPSLNKGVIVHAHDIFSPKDYPEELLVNMVRFWNEQYLLEAFLSHNNSWEIIGALNFLHHNYYRELKMVAPFLLPERKPASFYIKKIA